MAKIAFFGLGIMGYPMARNLLRAGHDVALWSHSGGKAQKLAKEAGGRACATPSEAAAGAECMFLCVGDTAMSREVILGKNGIIESSSAGSVVADASTIGPSASREIGHALKTKGVEFLDAPCTGSVPGAEGGTLTFMIGGDKAVFERVKPLFEPMGKRLYFCGAAGMGLQAKLTQNLILGNLLMAFNEGMVLAAKGGVELNLMLEILENSAAKSGLIAFKAPYVLRRDFDPKFSTKWMNKDIGLMLESGAELGVPLPMTGLTRQLFQAAIAAGYGEDDMCSTIKVLEGFAGVEVKNP
ncbi:MAG TPA: NAD(P)-dependent oxidoreductase [Bryobacteraceae bacterium]|nr:NAD(P)-dependent oxidoreductase [Bryobacteraceae bacterium]